MQQNYEADVFGAYDEKENDNDLAAVIILDLFIKIVYNNLENKF